jgi:triacylglycerol lipase
MMQPLNAHNQKEMIILLHGIGHTRLNMVGLAWALRRAGYATRCITYPSTRLNITDNAQWLSRYHLDEDFLNTQTCVHFVCHSMGGLVAGAYLDLIKDTISHTKISKVILLGPPHHGSRIADFLKNFILYRWFFGPAGQELTTAARALSTIKPYYDLGIIAGTKGWFYPVAHLLMKCNAHHHDGRVTIESTKIDGMTDHICISVTHSFMMWKPDVYKQILAFLKTGSFHHAP